MNCTHDWLQQSLRKLQLMTLMNPLIASKVSIGIMYDVIDQIRDLIFVVMKMQIRVTGSFHFVNLTVAKPLISITTLLAGRYVEVDAV